MRTTSVSYSVTDMTRTPTPMKHMGVGAAHTGLDQHHLNHLNNEANARYAHEQRQMIFRDQNGGNYVYHTDHHGHTVLRSSTGRGPSTVARSTVGAPRDPSQKSSYAR